MQNEKIYTKTKFKTPTFKLKQRGILETGNRASGHGFEQNKNKNSSCNKNTSQDNSEQINSISNFSETKFCPLYFPTKILGLIDSGAAKSLISEELFNTLPKHAIVSVCCPNTKLYGVTGHPLEIVKLAVIKFQIGRKIRCHTFHVIRQFSHKLILGIDFLTSHKVRANFDNNTIIIGNEVVFLTNSMGQFGNSASVVKTSQKAVIKPMTVTLVKLASRNGIKGNNIITPLLNSKLFWGENGLSTTCVMVKNEKQLFLPVYNETSRQFTLGRGQVVGLINEIDEESFFSNEHNTSQILATSTTAQNHTTSKNIFQNKTCPDKRNDDQEIQEKFKKLLEKYDHIFSKHETDLGTCNIMEASFDTGDALPIKSKNYRLPYSMWPFLEKHLQDLTEAGIIEPSQSPWSSPILFVPRKDNGPPRMCVDFRKLNKVLVKNSYPLPNIQDILATLHGSSVFSTIDAAKGFYQLKVKDSDRHKLAFTCQFGLYQFLKMPFGISTAPSIFQELMAKILAGSKHAKAFIDDVLIFSKTPDEHLIHLEDVFQRLSEAGIKLKMSKCKFFQSQIKFLGHVISSEGIAPDPEKISAIKNLKAPQTVKEVRSFIGMASYYRSFIENFSLLVKPISELTKKHSKFTWDDEKEKSFQILKDKLCSAPVLAHPNLNHPYKLYTDASDYAIGGILTQEIDGKERPIQYISRQLGGSELKWATIEKEAFAIIFSLNKLRQYLLGSKFTIYTDHKPLRSLFTSQVQNLRVQRWAVILSEFTCDIEYKTGKTNVQADLLSRIRESKDRTNTTPNKDDTQSKVTNEELTDGNLDHILSTYCDESIIFMAKEHSEYLRKSLAYLQKAQVACQNGDDHVNANKIKTIRDKIKETIKDYADDLKENYLIDLSQDPLFVNVIDNTDLDPPYFKRTIESSDEEDDLETVDSKLFEKISKMQDKDDYIKEVISELNENPNSKLADEFCILDGVLYHISTPVRHDNNYRMQVVIPDYLKNEILDICHNDEFAGGHLGQERSYDKLRRRFYWKNMYKDIILFVNKCSLCKARKMKKARIPMQDMPIPNYPMESLSIDTSGPYIEADCGAKYVVSIICDMSQWVECYATKDKTAETVAKILMEEFIPRHGCPRVLRSDNGSEYCNAIVSLLLEKFKITHIRTSAYKPSSNGRVERIHRFMNDFIAKYSHKDHRNWPKYLPAMMMAYRTSVHSSTLHTPFFLVYGRDPVLPFDLLLRPKLMYHGDNYLPLALGRLHKAYKEVQRNMCDSRESNKLRLGKKASLHNFEIGDAVFYLDRAPKSGECAKWSLKWRPFYRIIERTGPVNYRIKNQLTGNERLVHSEYLRPALPEQVWDVERDKPEHLDQGMRDAPERIQPFRRSKLIGDFNDKPSIDEFNRSMELSQMPPFQTRYNLRSSDKRKIDELDENMNKSENKRLRISDKRKIDELDVNDNDSGHKRLRVTTVLFK